MQDLPMVLRAADLRGLAQAALPLLPSGGGGLGDIEKILGFVERFVPLFQKASETLMAMRQFEGGGTGADNQEIWDGDAPPMRAAPAPRQTVQPVAPTPEIDPQRVYALLLGAMGQAPEGMTVADALALARDNKELMIGQIAAELKNL